MPTKTKQITPKISGRGGASARSVKSIVPLPSNLTEPGKVSFFTSAAILDQVMANVDLHIHYKELEPLIKPSSISYAGQMNALILVQKIGESDRRTDDACIGELEEPLPPATDSAVADSAKQGVPPAP